MRITDRQKACKVLHNKLLSTDNRMCFIGTVLGSDSYYAEIIEVGIVDRYGNTIMHSLVRPNMRIIKEVEDMYGITNKIVADAPRFSDIADELFGILGCMPVWGYDVIDAMNYIMRDSLRNGVNVPMSIEWAMKTNSVNCVSRLFAMYYGEKDRYFCNIYSRKSLTFACQYLGLGFVANTCGALVQADMSRRVALALGGLYKNNRGNNARKWR